MTVEITFLGAAGTVTGSKYYIKGSQASILVDAGMFQGKREWRERNWHNPDIDLKGIDATLLTHAHIDHTGILPRYYSLGMNSPVFCSKATHDLANILLPDSAYLQEEEAEWRNKKGKSRHSPALPLYTKKDVAGLLKNFQSVRFYEEVEVAPGVTATWTRMGHILGAAAINLKIDGVTITFSGDVGRYKVPILKDPEPLEFGDLLLIESTYGMKEHGGDDPKSRLAEIISGTVRNRGTVVIPSFAVGRAQLLLYYLREMKEEGLIPDVPVIIDSPMATSATEVYRKNTGDYDEEAIGIAKEGTAPFEPGKMYFTKSRDESKKLNSITDPMIIISASGMLAGGRILHHLHHRISSPKNTIVFVGYQPPGGRGDWLLRGEKKLRLFGDEQIVRAKIESISGLSAHGDRSELLDWCRACSGTPKQVAVVHGEPESAEAFAGTLRDEFDWQVKVPKYLETLKV